MKYAAVDNFLRSFIAIVWKIPYAQKADSQPLSSYWESVLHFYGSKVNENPKPSQDVPAVPDGNSAHFRQNTRYLADIISLSLNPVSFYPVHKEKQTQKQTPNPEKLLSSSQSVHRNFSKKTSDNPDRLPPFAIHNRCILPIRQMYVQTISESCIISGQNHALRPDR